LLDPFQTARSTYPEAATLLISDAWKAYRTDLLARREASEGRLNHRHSSLKLWIGVLGDRPIGRYLRSDAVAFRQKIAQLPDEYHHNKRYKAKTIDQIIETANAEELRRKARVQARKTDDEHVDIWVPRLKMKTINKHISVLSSFYKWLVEAGKLPRSHCSLLAGLGKKEKKSKYHIQEERAVWTKDKVRTLFSTPVWTGCLSRGRRSKPGPYVFRDWIRGYSERIPSVEPRPR